jgi:RHS repeat-associated protein
MNLARTLRNLNPCHSRRDGKRKHTQLDRRLLLEYLEDRFLPSTAGLIEQVAGPAFVTAPRIAVTLNTPATHPVTVNYAVTGGTAVANVDYKMAPGKLTFQPGQVIKYLPLTVVNHQINEPDKTIQIGLTGAASANIGIGTVVYTIQTDVPLPSVLFQTSSASGAEGKTAALGVNLSGASGQAITVPYTISGTAVSGKDYKALSGSVTFKPGQTAQTITLTTLDDHLFEDNETVVLTLNPPANIPLGFNPSLTYTITDNGDKQPSVSFVKTTASGPEGQTASLQVSLSGPSGKPVVVNFSTGGSATSGTDYSLASNSVTINPGATAANIPLNVLNTHQVGADKTVVLTLTGATGATLGSKNTALTYTIQEGKATVGFAAATLAGPQSQTSPTLPIVLNTASAQPVTVHYAVTGGTAKSGKDFTLAAGTLTIPAKQTTASIAFTVVNHAMNEADKTIVVTLTNPTNAFVNAASLVYKIQNDVAPPTVSFASGGPTTGAEGAKATFTVQLSAASGQTVTVPYTVTGLPGGTLTFTPTQTTQTLTLKVPDDHLYEDNESLQIALSTPVNATLGNNASVTYTVEETDPPPTVAFTKTTASGVQGETVNVPVTLSSASGKPATASYTLSGTAVQGVDYTLAGNNITVNPGDKSASIPLNIVDNHQVGANKTLVLTLTSPSGATLGKNQVLTLAIVETAPVLSLLPIPANLQPPTVTMTTSASGASKTNITVAGQVSDASGLRYVTGLQAKVDGTLVPISFDALGNFSYTTTFAVDGSADGMHTLAIVATDPAGNTATIPAGSFTLETVGPAIALRGPSAARMTNSNITVTGTVSDALSKVTSLQAQIDSGPAFPVPIDFFGGFDVPTALPLDGSADGNHTLLLTATNAAGLTSTTSLSFALDTQSASPGALALSITAPVAGAEHSSAARVIGSAGAAATSASFTLDGGTAVPLTLDASGNFDQAISATALTAGSHQVVIKASDNQAHIVQQTIAFTVSTGDFTVGPTGTAGWGYQTSSSVHLETRSSFVVQTGLPVPLGAAQGSRTVSFAIAPHWDPADQSTATGDELLVYLVDPNSPGQTLLSSGAAGTALFALPENGQAQYLPGVVRFDGSVVQIDVTNVVAKQGLLTFQLISDGTGTASTVDVTQITDTLDPNGTASPVYTPPPDTIDAAGPALTLGNLTTNNSLTALISNLRLDPTSGTYTAELRVRNDSSATVGRQVAVVFPGLPAGVALQQPSGTSAGAPYLNMQGTIGAGGLLPGATSDAVLLTFNDPKLLRFALTPQVLAAAPDTGPVLSPIGALSVAPGGYLVVHLHATDPGGAPITYSLKAGSLPTGRLQADGTLTFQPSPTDVGTYHFTAIASNGAATDTQPVTLTVAGTAAATTSISGVLLTPAGKPVAGVPVKLGSVQTTTAADGTYTLSFSGPAPGDQLEVQGDQVKSAAYAGYSIPLTQLTTQPLYDGFDNVVARPTYLTPVDTVGAVTVNPTKTTTLVSSSLPGATLVIPAGALIDQHGKPYSGRVSLTNVAPQQTPAALPAGQYPPVAVMIAAVDSPGTQLYLAGGTLTLPNTGGYAKGSQVKLEGPGNPPAQLGDGTVSDDGKTITFKNFKMPQLSPPSPGPDDEPQPPDIFFPGPEDYYAPGFLSPDDPSDSGSDDPPCDCEGSDAGPVDLPPEPAPFEPVPVDQVPADSPGLETPPDEEQDPSPWGSLVPITSPQQASAQGALQQNLPVGEYQSQGQSKQLLLHYDSMQADPSNIVHLDYQVNGGTYGRTDPVLATSMTINDGNFEYEMPGASNSTFAPGSGLQYFSVTGHTEYNVGIQADTSGIPTGEYTYTINAGVANNNNGLLSGTTTPATGHIIVVNSQDSPFGSGWQLAGWEEVVPNADGSALLVDGNGTRLLFGAPQSSGGPYTPAPGDYSTLIRNGDGTYQRTMPDQTQYLFNSAGQLTTITDANNNTTQFGYDGAGKLITLTDPVNKVTTFGYTNGMVTSVTTPDGHSTQLQHTGANLTAVTLPGGATQQYGYNAQHLLTVATDPDGHSSHDTYNFAGRVTSMSNGAGNTVQVSTPDVRDLVPLAQTLDLANPAAAPRPTPMVQTVVGTDGGVTSRTLNNLFEVVSSTSSTGAQATYQRSQDLVSQITDGDGNMQLVTYTDGKPTIIQDNLSGSAVQGSIGQAGDLNNYTFTATAGARIYYEGLSGDSGISATLTSPSGADAADIYSASNDDGPVTLVESGTYTLTFSGTQAGKYSFALVNAAGATPMTVNATISGTLNTTVGDAFYQISGSAGQRFDFHSLVNSTSTTGSWTLYGPDNSRLTSGNLSADLTTTLPMAGTCILVLKGSGAYGFIAYAPTTTTTSLTLGASTTATFTPGDIRNFTFSGQLGQRVYIDTEGAPLSVKLLAPDGTSLFSSQSNGLAEANAPVTLSQTGTITLSLTTSTPGAYSFVVSDVASLPLAALGTSVSGALNPISATGLYRINGTAGGQAEVNINDGSTLTWTLYGPGNQIVEGNNPDLDEYLGKSPSFPASFAETGTYVLVIQQQHQNGPGSYEFEAVDATQSPVTPVGFGTVQSGTLARGKQLTYAFSGSAGLPVFLDVQDQSVSYQITDTRPNVSPIHDVILNGEGVATLPYSSVANDPAHPMYAVTVTNNGFGTTSYRFRLLNLAAPGGATPLTFGTTYSATLTAPYQSDVYTLNTTPGQTLYYDAVAGTSSPYNPAATVQIIGPGVSNTSYTYVGNDAASNTVFTVQTGGPSYLIITNQQTTSVSYGFRLLDFAQSTPISLNTQVQDTLASSMQEALYQFTGTAGQYLYFDLESQSYMHGTLYTPQGSALTTNISPGNPTFTLPSSGTYYLAVDSPNGGSGSIDCTLDILTPTTNTMSLSEGAVTSGTLTALGQRDEYTFTGTAGEQVSLGGPQSPSGTVNVTLAGPDGQPLTISSYSQTSLPEAGTYTLIVSGSQPDSYEFRLIDSATASLLAPNTQVTGTLQFDYDRVLYAFNGSAGETVYLNGDTVYPNVYGPSGQSVTVQYSSAVLPATGTYLIELEPSYGGYTYPLSYNFEVLVPSRNVTPLTLGTEYSGTLSGQYDQQNFTFAGTAGQRVYFDSLGSSGNLGVGFTDPTSESVGYINAADDEGPYTLTATGTYTLSYQANAAGSNTYDFRLLDVASAPTFSVGTPFSGTLNPSKQVALYTFNGSAGQRLSFASTSDPSVTWELDGPADQSVTNSFSGNIASLPTTGSYIFVVHSSANSGSINYHFTATDVSDTPVTPSGFGVLDSGTLASNGQTAFTFTAPAGLPVFLDNEDASNSSFILQLNDPSNNAVFTTYGSYNSGLRSLPRSGTYTLHITNNGSSTAAFAFRLLDLTAAPAMTAGTAVSGTFANGTQTDVYRLAGTAGERLIGNPLGTNLNGAEVGLIQPNGGGFSSATTVPPVTTLGYTGTYYVTVTGTGGNGATYSLRLDDMTNLPVLTPGMTLTSASGALSFTGTAGQRIAFNDTGANASYYYTLNLYGPNGYGVSNSQITEPGNGFIVTLPTSGTYVMLPFTASVSGDYSFTFALPADTTAPVTLQGGSPGVGITYDSVFHKPTSVVDNLGNQTLYQLDPNTGNILTVTRVVPGGTNVVTTYTYTSSGQVSTVADPDGNVTKYGYDAADRLTTITYAFGTADQATVTYAYDDSGNIASRTDENNKTTTYLYDAMNRMTQVTDPLNNVTKYEYDPAGNLIKVTDGNGNITQYTYDGANREATMTAADNRVTTRQYNAAGDLIQVTDPLGQVTQYRYDASGRLTDTVDPTGGDITRVYDDSNNIVASTNADGHKTLSVYDSRNRLISQTDSLGNTTTYAYDANGNLISETDALGRTTQYTYDALNRLATTTDPLGNITIRTYDANGDLLTVTDALGNVTRYSYDARNRVISVTDPNNGVTTMTYDGNGNRTSITDPVGNITSYTYNGRDWVTQETTSLGTSTYTYDGVGNLIARTDANGQTTNYTYDKLNHETTETWLDGTATVIHTITYGYNKDGEMTSAADGSSNEQFAYDGNGRVTLASTSGTTGIPTVVMTYSYDAAGNVVFRADTIAGQAAGTIFYTYDVLNHPIEELQTGSGVSDERVNLQYDTVGQLTTIARYSDLAGTQPVAATQYTYDNNGRLTGIADSHGNTVLAAYVFGYDKGNRITSEASNDGSSQFAYDKTGQLTAVAGTGALAYSYDANGNRTNTGYQTGPDNEISSDGTYNYGYDANGNLTSQTNIATGAVTLCTYDYRNRLTEVISKDSGGHVLQDVTYAYDAFNNRIAETVAAGGSTTVQRFVYDGNQVAFTFDGSGNVTDRYLYLVNQVLADDRGQAQVLWPLADQVGSVRDIVDSTGSVQDHIQYDAFGNILTQSNPAIDFLFGFAGQQHDAATGLDYDHARFYDAALGRFLTQDPIAFGGRDLNLYRYVGNSPIANVDPLGRATFGVSGNTGLSGPFVSQAFNQLGGNWYDHTDSANQAVQQELGLGQDGRSDLSQDPARMQQMQNNLNNPPATDYNIFFGANGDIVVYGPNGTQVYNMPQNFNSYDDHKNWLQNIVDDIKNSQPPPDNNNNNDQPPDTNGQNPPTADNPADNNPPPDSTTDNNPPPDTNPGQNPPSDNGDNEGTPC